MATFRETLRAMLADRHGPEARALFVTIAGYVEGRVRWFGRVRGADLFSEAELEEVVGEVVLQLMAGSLAQFRGGSLPELLAFVRTITDRTTWRAARRRIEEKRVVEDGSVETALREMAHVDRAADEDVLLGEVPIEEKDRTYLAELFAAGSKAEYARRAGVSRAAVTKRVDRIRARIAAMPPRDRQASEAWLEFAARQAVVGSG
jgi:DNA-directed RNA polymerase specialized sigma24 family protein